MRHQVWTFLRLVGREWASLVTGSLSALLLLVGLCISLAGTFGLKIPADSAIQLGTWLLAAICGGQAAYSAWAREHAICLELQRKLSAHAHGLSFQFASSFDSNNNDNAVEIRTIILNKADTALSWVLRLMEIRLGNKVLVDKESGPFIIHRGEAFTWFPNKGLSLDEYNSLIRETIGSLHFEILYGHAELPHDRIADGTIKLRLFKNPGNGEVSLNWEIERMTDKALDT